MMFLYLAFRQYSLGPSENSIQKYLIQGTAFPPLRNWAITTCTSLQSLELLESGHSTLDQQDA
jgi:hypothetical protein